MKFFKIAQFFAAIDIERRRERAKDDSLLLMKGVEARERRTFRATRL